MDQHLGGLLRLFAGSVRDLLPIIVVVAVFRPPRFFDFGSGMRPFRFVNVCCRFLAPGKFDLVAILRAFELSVIR